MPNYVPADTPTSRLSERTTHLRIPSTHSRVRAQGSLNHNIYISDVRISSPTVARDQEVDIPTQLALGVRLLQAQAHLYAIAFIASSSQILAHAPNRKKGVLHFCHTSAFLDTYNVHSSIDILGCVGDQ